MNSELPERSNPFDETKSPGIDRIIGINDSSLEKTIKRAHASSILEDRPLEPFEREKTHEEEELIIRILTLIPDFVLKYGADQGRFTSLEQICLIDESNTESEKFKEFSNINGRAYYNFSNKRIEILPSKIGLLNTAVALVHELIHANSFFSVTLTKKMITDGNYAENRQVGLELFRKDNNPEKIGASDKENLEFFKNFNEAVTEELTKRFCEQYFREMPILRDEIDDREKSNGPTPQAPDDTLPAFKVALEHAEKDPLYGYVNERIVFAGMIDAIYHSNKDKFQGTEDVFKMFSTAMFTGKVLDLARLIEKTFGKGSFKTIGKNMAKGISNEDFIKNLSEIIT